MPDRRRKSGQLASRKNVYGNGINMRGEMRYWSAIVQIVFHRADTLTVRLLLANASIIWGIGAILVPSTFLRNGYQIMHVLPNWLWAALFMAHGVGVYWRIFDPKHRTGWALFVNGLGLAVWLLSTILINLAIGDFVLGTSLEWIMCVASGWTMYRTGLKSEFKLLTD